MASKEPNPSLQRTVFALRASGSPLLDANHLRDGVHHRGYLPHIKREGVWYFVTFRLADSLPQCVLRNFQSGRAARIRALTELAPESRHESGAAGIEDIDRHYRRDIERYLDQGAGACHLRHPPIAAMAGEALRHDHARHYLLESWVIMPNHVHLVLFPLPNFTLSEILKSRKQYIATQANRLLGRIGQPFWQVESYDHWIRNELEKARITRYIRSNPVKAGLCVSPEGWPWSSAGWAASHAGESRA